MSAGNDPKLGAGQYLTDELLRTRQQIHEQYTLPRIDFAAWVLSNVVWRGDEAVLDLGCGNGRYYAAMADIAGRIDAFNPRYVGMDLAADMMHSHAARPMGVLNVGDATRLPFATSSFDLVMANHMLYHVTDIDGAIREVKRVLKPDGLFLATTNSTQSLPELQVLLRRAIILLTRENSSSVQAPAPLSDLFALENGTRRLSRHFYAVRRADLPSQLVFTDLEPLMAYIETTRSVREPQLPADVHWDDVMAIMRQQITHLIGHLGELAINKLNGVLIASDNGGFVAEFLRYREQARRNNLHE